MWHNRPRKLTSINAEQQIGHCTAEKYSSEHFCRRRQDKTQCHRQSQAHAALAVPRPLLYFVGGAGPPPAASSTDIVIRCLVASFLRLLGNCGVIY